MPAQLSPAQFVAKWSKVSLPERAASQEHFIDLCHLLAQPTPAEHDATGAEYAFEKCVPVTGAASVGSRGERGIADVWWRGKFAWEYKRKGKCADLTDAYRQLCQYREALENPPLLVVSDIAHTEIHTNFTGTKKEVHTVELAQLAEPEAFGLLRRVFTDPESFRPEITTERVTEAIAKAIGALAVQIRSRGHEPHQTAHFLMKCMFCLFAEDIRLLPENLFQRLVTHFQKRPADLAARLTELFAQMRKGGAFGAEEIPYVNGGLFDDDTPAIELTEGEIIVLLTAARQDWSAVEPAIFGTLFERSLDPNTRAQIGAHYTSKEDILLVVEPVVMAPLRREWEQVQAEVEAQLERRRKAKTAPTRRKADAAIEQALRGFVHRLASVRILDPACGSGNFLYVAIQQLLDLEKEVITYAARPDIALGLFPQVRPTQLHGIEINPYASELAQVVIWIGYLQWMRDNGFAAPRDPILEPLQSIENRDAILDVAQPPSAEEHVRRGPEESQPRAAVPQQQPRATVPHWPEADFIIGNPPFLGSRRARIELGDPYVRQLHATYRDRLREGADLCCYWFDRAASYLQSKGPPRVGLLATQAIRKGSSRDVLDQVASRGQIFFAESNRPWILDGADVRIAIIGFDSGQESERQLDGRPTDHINSDLTIGVDLTTACPLRENMNLSFQGTISSGPFDLSWEQAREMLESPNVGPHTNAAVLRPWRNGNDLAKRCRGMWIIDFGIGASEEDAARFESPFEYVLREVRPGRDKTKYAPSQKYPFWQLWNPRAEMRKRTARLSRYVATPRVTKHRVFAFLPQDTLPDARLVAIASDEDYLFGVLHSSVHELWALRQSSRHGIGNDPTYNTTTCFETFPQPWAPGSKPVAQPPSAEANGGGGPEGTQRGAVVQPQPRATVPHSQPGAAVPHAQPGAGVPHAKGGPARYRRHLPHIQPGERPVFVTFCTRRGWVLPESIRGLVVQHCLHDDGTKLQMHALVVMPDRVHLVFTPGRDDRGNPYGLSEIMSGIKGASAHSINKVLKRKGSVWQDESFDHVLRQSEGVIEKAEYICQNPVRKGLVRDENEYPWLWREWIEGEDVAQPPSAGRRSLERQPRAGVPHSQPRAAGLQRQPGAAVVHQRIGDAAAALNEQRERWLNPPEWIEPIAAAVDAEDDFADVPDEARGLIRQSAIMARAAKDPRLKRRTLTNLYNERPTWLKLAHEALDRAVLAAYALVDPEGAWSEDWAKAWVDTGAGQPLPDDHPLAERRGEVDQQVLANLLRLNLARAGQG